MFLKVDTLLRIETGEAWVATIDKQSREFLDPEYNNQSKVKNFKNYVAEWQAMSNTARAEISDVKVFTYDDQSGQKLDLIYPTSRSDAPFPIQVFFHGGYWKALDRSLFYFVARSFADFGIATAIVDYQLIPSIQLSELVRQCRASVAFIYKQAQMLELDKNNIHAFGHSAGGHIAAMCLATKWSEFGEDLPPQILKTASGVSGLYNLEPISKCFLQDDLHLSSEDVKQFSPSKLATPAQGQMHLIVGSKEGQEYEAQSDALFQNWQSISSMPEILAPYDHFTIMSAFSDPTSAPARLVRAATNIKD